MNQQKNAKNVTLNKFEAKNNAMWLDYASVYVQMMYNIWTVLLCLALCVQLRYKLYWLDLL